MTKMYTSLVTTFVAIAALATVAPVQAQAQQVHLVARVPFDFAVGDANLPHDTYRLSRDSHSGIVFVRGKRTGAFVLASEERLGRGGAQPTLVFHRYGDQYFLRQVRWEDTARLDLPETKTERAAAENHAARVAAGKEIVTIVAERR